jgi:hypothetical protein
MAIIPGTADDDDLHGAADADTFTLGDGGHDTAHGGAGRDVFEMGGSFDTGDSLYGGSGSDTVVLDGDYSGALLTFGPTMLNSIRQLVLTEDASNPGYLLKSDDANVLAGRTLTVTIGSTSAVTTVSFDGSAETDGSFTFIAGAGDFTATGGAQGDTFNMRHAITPGQVFDLDGGGGGDRFLVKGFAFTDSDAIDGGSGSDSITFTGDTDINFAAGMVTNVETFIVKGGSNFDLTLDDSIIGAGKTLTVDGTGLGFAHTHFAYVDASAESDGGIDFIGGNGVNTLVVGSAAVLAASSYDGTIGTDDGLILDGDFSAGVTLSGSNLTGLEYLGVEGGHDQVVTLDDSLIGAGQTLKIDLTGIGFSDFVTIDARGETDGFVNLRGFGGSFILQIDSAAVLDGSKINGGPFSLGAIELSGSDFTGGYVLGGVTPLKNLAGVVLDAGNDYQLVMTNASFDGTPLIVDGSALGAADHMGFDGSAVTRLAPFWFMGGAGDDALSGSDCAIYGVPMDLFDLSLGGDDLAFGNAGADLFNLGAALTAADSINGGDGYDAVLLSGDYTGANAVIFSATTLTSISYLGLDGGFSYDLTVNNANVAAGTTMIVDGRSLGAGDSLTFDASAETDGVYRISGGAGDDVITGGANGGVLNIVYGGNDTATGGAGNDLFRGYSSLTADDRLTGGGGNDVLRLHGDYTGADALVLGAATISGIGKIILVGGHSYDLTTDDANVAAGATMTINAAHLAIGNTLTFDGSAETDGAFIFLEGAISDTLIGGAGDDTFTMNLADTGPDTFTGGTGADTFVYTAPAQSTGVDFDTITDFAAGTDKIDVPTTIAGIGAVSGSVSSASFDGDLDGLGAAQSGLATVVTVTGGDFAGQTLLVVDGDGDNSYVSGSDYVFNITGYTGTVTTGDFI